MVKRLLILLSLALCACETPNVEHKGTGFRYGSAGNEMKEYNIEGCQYIGKIEGSNTDWLTHKGNCNNPIHNK
jgi:hypothetical protein